MVLRYTFLVFTEAPYGSGSKCSLRFIGGWWPCFSTNQCCKILKSYILDLVLTDSKHWLIAKRLLLRWTSVFNFKSIGFTVQDVLSKCVFLCPFFFVDPFRSFPARLNRVQSKLLLRWGVKKKSAVKSVYRSATVRPNGAHCSWESSAHRSQSSSQV